MTSAARPTAGALYAPSRSHPLAGRTILQIIPELEAGGAERTAVDIAAGLVAVGARALVATEGGRLVGELQAKGGVWASFPAATKNPFRMLLNVRRLARLCVEERVALVHARSRAPAWAAHASSATALVPCMSDLKPPSQTTPGTAPSRIRTAMRRADCPFPTLMDVRLASLMS